MQLIMHIFLSPQMLQNGDLDFEVCSHTREVQKFHVSLFLKLSSICFLEYQGLEKGLELYLSKGWVISIIGPGFISH